MSEIFVVAMDGSSGCQRALDLALMMAKSSGQHVVLAHVIEWSAFSFHTPEELAERHKRREEELERAHEAILGPAMARAASEGVEAEAVVLHGHPAETLSDLATERRASNIFIGRKGQSRVGNLLFGSVAGSLVQASPIAVTVVP